MKIRIVDPASSTNYDSPFLFFPYLSCQLLQPEHEWFIERKMSPHVVTRLICLTGTAAFPWIQHRNAECGAALEAKEAALNVTLTFVSRSTANTQKYSQERYIFVCLYHSRW